jgi:DNA-binding winged helix-turn-helix (wHTH) protein
MLIGSLLALHYVANILSPWARGWKIPFRRLRSRSSDGRATQVGHSHRIQSQPFQILQLLLERSGEVVSREEIQTRFWEENSMVDLDESLATAIHKIRACLGDSVTQPRYVETLARNGYRFIAPVTSLDPMLRAADPTARERNSSQSATATAVP